MFPIYRYITYLQEASNVHVKYITIFSFSAGKITKQTVFLMLRYQLTAVPDERFHPICHVCGSKAQRIYRHDKRALRDMNLGPVRVWINCSYRKIACESCNRIVVEDLGFSTLQSCYASFSSVYSRTV
ncbi:MAG: hypothetical protein HS132_13160 [Planctomycetia bacterium]|nr:hypothetical protein [Planctomycetia bacterium]